MIIPLCGSTSFKDNFEAFNKYLSLRGRVKFSLPCFSHHNGDILSKCELEMLKIIQRKKIFERFVEKLIENEPQNKNRNFYEY